MITCRRCHAVHLEGTLFCDQCGSPLVSTADEAPGEAAPPTGKIKSEFFTSKEAGSEAMVAQEPTSAEAIQAGAVGTLQLTVLSTGRVFRLPARGQVLIGRRDSLAGVFPDLDLTPDGAVAMGVSRSHARITSDETGSYVEDLNSLNHTHLNRERLVPHQPRALRAGDELQLGRLAIRVESALGP